jgi:hypothetical protein
LVDQVKMGASRPFFHAGQLVASRFSFYCLPHTRPYHHDRQTCPHQEDEIIILRPDDPMYKGLESVADEGTIRSVAGRTYCALVDVGVGDLHWYKSYRVAGSPQAHLASWSVIGKEDIIPPSGRFPTSDPPRNRTRSARPRLLPRQLSEHQDC